MGRKEKQNEFEVIVPLSDDVENMISEHTKILDSNNVLNRLNNLERDYENAYNILVSWVYSEFKSTVPCSDPEQVDKIPLMSVLKRIPSDKFGTFLGMLERCEDTVKFNKSHGTVIEEPTVPDSEYITFAIARYALTDVIEELTAAKVKDIIVTKVDNNLVVKYKPAWRK